MIAANFTFFKMQLYSFVTYDPMISEFIEFFSIFEQLIFCGNSPSGAIFVCETLTLLIANQKIVIFDTNPELQ